MHVTAFIVLIHVTVLVAAIVIIQVTVSSSNFISLSLTDTHFA